MLRICCLISACLVALPVAASVSVQEGLEMDAERYRQAAHEAMSRVVQREVARAHEEGRRSKNAVFDLMSAAELAAYHRCIDLMLTMDEAVLLRLVRQEPDACVVCEISRRLEEGDHCEANPALAQKICEQELLRQEEGSHASPRRTGLSRGGMERRLIRLYCRAGQEDKARQLVQDSDWMLAGIDWLMGRRDDASARRFLNARGCFSRCQGDPRAAERLAICYEEGLGVPRSAESAQRIRQLLIEEMYASLYRNSAEEWPSGRLACALRGDPEGVAQLRWLAARGFPEAMRVLALLYEHGSPFLRPDAEAARFWRARYESCQPQS